MAAFALAAFAKSQAIDGEGGMRSSKCREQKNLQDFRH